MILRVLAWGPTHGHNIVKGIQRASDEALLIEHGSLYPTLQRLEERALITAEWGVSENNRKARFYRLTSEGRRALARETSRWERLMEEVITVTGHPARPGKHPEDRMLKPVRGALERAFDLAKAGRLIYGTEITLADGTRVPFGRMK